MVVVVRKVAVPLMLMNTVFNTDMRQYSVLASLTVPGKLLVQPVD